MQGLMQGLCRAQCSAEGRAEGMTLNRKAFPQGVFCHGKRLQASIGKGFKSFFKRRSATHRSQGFVLTTNRMVRRVNFLSAKRPRCERYLRLAH